MLGHIFENLLEDNKDKGAYYTPKAIVSYMARQSLLHYLQTHLGENAELAVLLNEKDTAKHTDADSFVRQNAKRIADLLDAVKICDPAIGSGAFPIGLLQEILWTRLTLNWELNTPEERAKLKRRIIQNSIHGVDLDPGAVEIARLRFWLALVVDEDQPRPLPNLDYKIHRADSLIEYIRGEPVHLGKVSAEDKRTHGAIQKLIEAKAQLFTAQKVPEKRAARFALYRALAEVAMAEFTWLRNDMGLIADDAERAAQLDHGLKEFGHRIRLIDSVAKESAKTQDHVLAELRAWFDDDKNPTFLWQLHFGEVFAQGGFDIVIANPPYLFITAVPKELRTLYLNRFATGEYRFDVYGLFFELTCDSLLTKNGVLCYLTPHTLLSNKSFTRLRQHLYEECHLLEVLDIGPGVFAEASNEVMICLARRKSPAALKTNLVSVALMTAKDFPKRTASFEVPQNQWAISHSDGWYIGSNTNEADLLAKLQKFEESFGALCRINQGLRTGDNEKFVSAEKKSAAWKPVVGGRDIARYKPPVAKSYVHYVADQLDAPRDPAIFASHEKILVQEVRNIGLPRRIIATLDKSRLISLQTTNVINLKAGVKHWRLSSLLAVLNSSAVNHFFRSKFRGNNHISATQLASIPIPPASDADKARLSQLAEACAAAAQRGDEATLAVHEAEIDQIVYRLFDLTPDEIALIESALAPTRTAKPSKRQGGRAVATPSSPATAYPDSIPVEALPASTELPATTPDISPAVAAWLPGELLSLEGELTPAKKARAAPKAASTNTASIGKKKATKGAVKPTAKAVSQAAASNRTKPTPISDIPRDEVMAAIRELFADSQPRSTEIVVRELCQKFGHQRVSAAAREVLLKDLFAASRRQILFKSNDHYMLLYGQIGDYDQESLKRQFLAAIAKESRGWHSREDAIRLFARHLGFRRTGSVIEKTARSLITKLLKEGKLEKDGTVRIRRR